jgi:hypothetical protein
MPIHVASAERLALEPVDCGMIHDPPTEVNVPDEAAYPDQFEERLVFAALAVWKLKNIGTIRIAKRNFFFIYLIIR